MMHTRLAALSAVLLLNGVALAGHPSSSPAPYCPTPGVLQPMPSAPDGMAAPLGPGPAPAPSEATPDLSAQAPEAGGQPSASAAPGMFGDAFGRQLVTPLFAVITAPNGSTQILPLTRNGAQNPNVLTALGTAKNAALTANLFVGGSIGTIPAGTVLNPAQIQAVLNSLSKTTVNLPAGGNTVQTLLKITENESPVPTTRAYINYNYFNNAFHSLGTSDAGQINANQVLFGFERCFMDGNASFGMRLPFNEFSGGDGDSITAVGDLSIIFKYALLNDCDHGRVVSVGLVTTLPTGSTFAPDSLDSPSFRDWLFQPFVGALARLGDNAYVQGFTSFVLPTDPNDVTLFVADLGVGYFAYRNCDGGMLTSVVPTVELHANIPLNHQGALAQPTSFTDLIDVTAGATFGLGSRSTLGVAATIPVTGPRPFDFEGQVQFNVRF
jgi:hypothetical protein